MKKQVLIKLLECSGQNTKKIVLDFFKNAILKVTKNWFEIYKKQSDFEYIIKELKAKRFELAVLEQKIKNCRFLVSP